MRPLLLLLALLTASCTTGPSEEQQAITADLATILAGDRLQLHHVDPTGGQPDVPNLAGYPILATVDVPDPATLQQPLDDGLLPREDVAKFCLFEPRHAVTSDAGYLLICFTCSDAKLKVGEVSRNTFVADALRVPLDDLLGIADVPLRSR